MNKTYLILDCNYLCHRAKYSMGDLSYEEEATGVVFGFLHDILNFQKKFKTSDIIFCWDSKTNKREEIFPDYKSKRKDKCKDMTKEELVFEKDFRKQMKMLRRSYLKIMGYKNIFCQKGYESDDLIASLCHNLSDDDDAIIISSDKDLYQLLSFNVCMYNPQQHKKITASSFKEEYGIKAKEWGMVKAIAGCPTDGVPGVPGVGEKTAIKFLNDKLKVTSVTFLKIKKFCWNKKSREKKFLRNFDLVVLPLKGTKIFKLKKDKPSQQGWKRVKKLLGINSLALISLEEVTKHGIDF